MKMMITDDNGSQIQSYDLPENLSMAGLEKCVDILRTGADEYAILNRHDYIAAKFWTEEDVKNCLVDRGYLPTDENVALVANNLKSLGDCTDNEWEVIYGAIRENASELERAYPPLESMDELLQATVEFEENNCITEEIALTELKEMGFNEYQLRYFGFRKLEGPTPLCFAATYKGSEQPDRVAFDLLIQIVQWFQRDCVDRHELEEIGFPMELLEAAM